MRTRIIYGAKFIDVDEGVIERYLFYKTNPFVSHYNYPLDLNKEDSPTLGAIEIELASIRRFCTQRGEEYEELFLGIDEQTRNALSVLDRDGQAKFDEAREEIHSEVLKNISLEKELNSIKQSSIWTRIKWVFCGVK